MNKPRPYSEWQEDMGNVLWFLWPIEQAPWVGTPLDLGRAVSFDVTVQIGIDVYEVEPKAIGDTGGWPWKDADEETEARLFWTPLPDCNALDEAIRDHIRGGPDPLKDPAVTVDVGQVAIDLVVSSLSGPQVALLRRLDRKAEFWTYRVDTRGVALPTCMALVKRGIMEGDPYRPFENGGRGFVRLTAFGEAIRNILIVRSGA